MTNSQLTATAATAATAAAVVRGPGQSSLDLTMVLPLHGPASALRYVIERLSEALYAQCISFEMVAVSDAAFAAGDDELNGLPLTRFVQVDQSDLETSRQVGSSVASGQWIGFLEVDNTVDVDAYSFIELLHQARERSAGRA